MVGGAMRCIFCTVLLLGACAHAPEKTQDPDGRATTVEGRPAPGGEEKNREQAVEVTEAEIAQILARARAQQITYQVPAGFRAASPDQLVGQAAAQQRQNAELGGVFMVLEGFDREDIIGAIQIMPVLVPVPREEREQLCHFPLGRWVERIEAAQVDGVHPTCVGTQYGPKGLGGHVAYVDVDDVLWVVTALAPVESEIHRESVRSVAASIRSQRPVTD